MVSPYDPHPVGRALHWVFTPIPLRGNPPPQPSPFGGGSADLFMEEGSFGLLVLLILDGTI